MIDLSGKYAIPPFGEAHNHNIEPSSRLGDTIRRYIAAGIFYVKNPNNLPRARTALFGSINSLSSIDVVRNHSGDDFPAAQNRFLKGRV